MNLYLISLILFSYGLGSIPFALVVSKAKGVDLRKVGSGNLGSTNVYRAMGLNYALLVFFLDALKGFIPACIATYYFQNPLFHILVGGVSIIGHSLTPFAKFKGGKGAATGLGVLAAISPKVFLILFVVAAALIGFTRMVSLASITCSFLAPILLWFFDYPVEYIIVVTVLCLFIVFRHRSNIQRLLQGKENKV